MKTFALLVSALAFSTPFATLAQTDADGAPAGLQEARPSVGGDLRAPSPKALDRNRRGYFQAGAGPAYGAGFKSDSLMYDVVGSYNFNLSNRLTAKGIADFAMASGSVSSRVFNFGAGAEYYIPEISVSQAIPYVAGDIGIGFARNALEQTATGLSLGAGAGVKFQAADLNFDVNAHYAQLTAEVGDAVPSVFALRGSVLF